MRQKLGLSIKEWRRFWVWTFLGTLMITGIVWFVNYNKQNKNSLEEHGKYRIATTIKKVWRVSRGRTDVQYYFFVNGKKYIGWSSLPVVNGHNIEAIIPDGRYMVKYLPENPDVSEIDFWRPDTTGLKR